MQRKQITTAKTVLRKLKLGGSLEVHPWGGYHLWDENGGPRAIPVTDTAASEAIGTGRLRSAQSAFGVMAFTYSEE